MIFNPSTSPLNCKPFLQPKYSLQKQVREEARHTNREPMEGDGLPLNTTVILPKTRKNIKIDRALTLCRGICLLLLLRYRLNNPLEDAFIIWAIAGFCECLFVLNFIIFSLLKWRPVERQTYPHTLSARNFVSNSRSCRYEKRGEACKLYPVDIFITTADPQKEPPLITANTILSVLAVGYPTDRVSCYVSDDSASPVIFCMMLEVFTFAKKWVPFCKSHSVEPRSPAKFFSSHTASSLSEQGNELKEEYEQLENRINDLAQRPREALKIARRYTSWASDNPCDHPPIVEVVNNIGIDRSEWNAPLLVYVAREKREGYKHQFKAGALNALMRVSGVLSNSPFILNLDCDTYINDSNALRHAMCVFMDAKLGANVGFVQFPQVFDNLDRQDVHGNRLVFLYDVLLKGLDGIQGPYYCGTGCFLRRTALHGVETQEGSLLEDFRLEIGKSALTKHDQGEIARVSKEAFLDLCSCNHEEDTAWGKQAGWRYGSSTEDVLTGYGIHCLGWRSIYLWLTPPAFKGIAPSTAPDRLAQRKRIAAGLVSMLLMQSSSFFYNRKTRLMFLQRIAYIYNCMFYAGISVFAMIYMVLHVACLFSSKSLTPKVREYETMWFVGALCFQHGMSFLEFKWGVKNERFSVREWWNEERFWFVSNVSCFVLGTLEALFKSIGLVESSFTITPKALNSKSEFKSETPYAINASLLFILPMTLVMFVLLAMMSTTIHVFRGGVEVLDYMGGELLFGMWSLFILYPIVCQITRVLKEYKAFTSFVMLASFIVTILSHM